MFHERTRDAQAVAKISKQSTILLDEQELRKKVIELTNRREIIERPINWYAYHLAIASIEFWHGSKDRFHKRLRYNLKKGVWTHERLQP